jgi:LysM repeat protein
MAIVDNSGTGLAALGRNEDRFMAHVAPGEMVVPPVISDKTRSIIRKEMAAVGLDPNEYVVGQGMSINPITGQAEFGFLKKIAKSVKKVVKKVAPIAAVIPGPWQPFAAVYQKGNAALKLAKGEGGLGDIMTLAAGGRQSLFGKEGAIEAIKSGTGILDPTKLGDAFKNIGQVAKLDAAGNIVKDAAGNIVTEFSPLAYGSNVLQGIASDQQQGYGGLLGGTGQKFNVVTGQLEGAVGGAGYNPFMRQATPTTATVQSGDTLSEIAKANNTTVEAIMKANPGITDPNVISVGQTLNIPGTTSSQSVLSRIISGTPGQQNPIQEFMDDQLGLDPGGGGIYNLLGGGSGDGTGTGGFGGIDPKMAGLALLYGKVVKDAAKKTEGGLTDIRQSKRPDLNPAPVFAGFDLGIRKKASFGGPIGFGRQYFNEGGMAVKELDMRQGGESVGPGTGTSDDIPAMLSDGEFVMTAAANNGAGGFKFNKTKKGIELIAASKPNREKGVDVMTNLMETFEKYNKSGSMA